MLLLYLEVTMNGLITAQISQPFGNNISCLLRRRLWEQMPMPRNHFIGWFWHEFPQTLHCVRGKHVTLAPCDEQYRQIKVIEFRECILDFCVIGAKVKGFPIG